MNKEDTPKNIPPEVKVFGEGLFGVPIGGDESLMSPEQREFQKNLDVMQKCATLVGNARGLSAASGGK